MYFSYLALLAARSATSIAAMFSLAVYKCTRLIPVLTTAIGADRTQIILNIPNDNGPKGTAIINRYN